MVQADTTYKNDLILQGRSKEGLLDTCISINKCTSLGAITSTSTHKRCCHDFESAGKCFMFGWDWVELEHEPSLLYLSMEIAAAVAQWVRAFDPQAEGYM